MSETTANIGTTGATVKFNGVEWQVPEPDKGLAETRLSDGPMFQLLVGHFNELIFIPKTALAQSLLAMWVCGGLPLEIRTTVSGDLDTHRYGGGISRAIFRMRTRPMLSSGDDPYFTGMTLTNDEAKAARVLVDKMRAKEYKTARQERSTGRRRNKKIGGKK